MRKVLSLVVGASVVLAGGCIKRAARTESAFMQQHVPKAFFEEFAKNEGLECTEWNAGAESGMLPCRKDAHIEIDGGLPVRNKAMFAYYKYVQKAITSGGLTINGHCTLGGLDSLSTFDLDYSDGAITGFFYANAVVNDRGKVDIFVVMYEHLQK